MIFVFQLNDFFNTEIQKPYLLRNDKNNQTVINHKFPKKYIHYNYNQSKVELRFDHSLQLIILQGTIKMQFHFGGEVL
jgi:hypothetical protein